MNIFFSCFKRRKKNSISTIDNITEEIPIEEKLIEETPIEEKSVEENSSDEYDNVVYTHNSVNTAYQLEPLNDWLKKFDETYKKRWTMHYTYWKDTEYI